MDTGRFDDLLRSLSEPSSRRGIARAMGGLILAGSLGSLLGLTDAEAGKKKKRCKCKACRTCKKGKCKPQPDDTPLPGHGPMPQRPVQAAAQLRPGPWGLPPRRFPDGLLQRALHVCSAIGRTDGSPLGRMLL